MSGWVLWAVLACAFGVGEMLTGGFFLAPFALGAALAAIIALAGVGSAGPWVAFVAVTLACLLFLRPVARAHLHVPAQLRTGSAAMIGQQAIVLERIANSEGVGCIKLDGEVWTARAFDDDEVIERGARVHVVDIKGATALVTE